MAAAIWSMFVRAMRRPVSAAPGSGCGGRPRRRGGDPLALCVSTEASGGIISAVR